MRAWILRLTTGTPTSASKLSSPTKLEDVCTNHRNLGTGHHLTVVTVLAWSASSLGCVPGTQSETAPCTLVSQVVARPKPTSLSALPSKRVAFRDFTIDYSLAQLFPRFSSKRYMFSVLMANL